jgi:hypothetical protein
MTWTTQKASSVFKNRAINHSFEIFSCWAEHVYLIILKAYNVIWGFHSSYNLDCDLLSYKAVWFCRWLPTFQRNLLPPSYPTISSYKTTQKTTFWVKRCSGNIWIQISSVHLTATLPSNSSFILCSFIQWIRNTYLQSRCPVGLGVNVT